MAAGRPRLRVCLLLLVVAAVVLGLGLATGGHAPEAEPLTETEKAQLAARDTANRLADRAAMLADAAEQPIASVPANAAVLADAAEQASASVPDRAATLADTAEQPSASVPARAPVGTDAAGDSSAGPVQHDALTSASRILRQQARLLQTPSLPPTPSGQSTTAQYPAEEVASGAEDFIAELAESAQNNLAGARSSDPGIARLLASIGTGQLLLAIELADRHQVPAPAIAPEVTAHHDLPAAKPSTCPSSGPIPGSQSDTSSITASATPSSTAADAEPDTELSIENKALISVLQAEKQAAYAYEVATADAHALANAESRERHTLAAGQLRALLHRACVSARPKLEAYALTPGFLDNPAAGLEQLEQQLLTSYADLIGLSNTPGSHAGNARDWAITKLAQSALQHRNPEAVPPATPGLDW